VDWRRVRQYSVRKSFQLAGVALTEKLMRQTRAQVTLPPAKSLPLTRQEPKVRRVRAVSVPTWQNGPVSTFFPIILWSGAACICRWNSDCSIDKATCALSSPADYHQWHIAYRGFPLAVLIFMLVQILHIGLAGCLFGRCREWWGRLGGMLGLLTLWITIIYVISIRWPQIVDWFSDHHGYRWIAACLMGGITGTGYRWEKTRSRTCQWPEM